jgi:hypothetical protein
MTNLIDDRHAALVVPVPTDSRYDDETLIQAGSAVLARLDPDGGFRLEKDGMVPVWFQGNLHDAVKLRRFNERGARKAHDPQ